MSKLARRTHGFHPQATVNIVVAKKIADAEGLQQRQHRGIKCIKEENKINIRYII